MGHVDAPSKLYGYHWRWFPPAGTCLWGGRVTQTIHKFKAPSRPSLTSFRLSLVSHTLWCTSLGVCDKSLVTYLPAHWHVAEVPGWKLASVRAEEPRPLSGFLDTIGEDNLI
jgi:hypothetical protein